MEAIVKLPSYIRHLKAIPLVVHLSHKNKSQLLQDIREVNRLFREKFLDRYCQFAYSLRFFK